MLFKTYFMSTLQSTCTVCITVYWFNYSSFCTCYSMSFTFFPKKAHLKARLKLKSNIDFTIQS